MPNLTGITRPHRTSYASVPRSIKSSFVKTAKVLRPISNEYVHNTFHLIRAAFYCMLEVEIDDGIK